MKIGVDFDDVLLDINTSLAHFHNLRYGTNYERKDIKSWFLENIWGCTPHQAVERVEEWYDSPWHDQTGLMIGALEAITKLAEQHELYIVTARPEQATEMTHKLVKLHFRDAFRSVHFANHFKTTARSKGDICRELGITLMIEDSLNHARAVAETGVSVLLFDSPWNQEPIESPITRVFGWEEILSFIADHDLLTK